MSQHKRIDLTQYEDKYNQVLGYDDSYSDHVTVTSPTKDGNITRESLWDAANPSDAFFNDGVLSFDEARGKTFEVPMYFCRDIGGTSITVKTFQDFQELRKALWAPIGLEANVGHYACSEKPNPSPPSKDSRVKTEDHDSTMSNSLETYLTPEMEEVLDGLREDLAMSLIMVPMRGIIFPMASSDSHEYSSLCEIGPEDGDDALYEASENVCALPPDLVGEEETE